MLCVETDLQLQRAVDTNQLRLVVLARVVAEPSLQPTAVDVRVALPVDARDEAFERIAHCLEEPQIHVPYVTDRSARGRRACRNPRSSAYVGLMRALREEQLVGLNALAAVTQLLQRVRTAHPTAGLFEAADVQWWWGQRERITDDQPQLVWFDIAGHPEAAVIATAFGAEVQLNPTFLPDVEPDLVAQVMERGLAHAHEQGHQAVMLEVDPANAALRTVLAHHGLQIEDDGLVETWLDAIERPPISNLPDGYSLRTRAETAHLPHHMISALRNHPDPEARLRQTSLYRPELDLAIYDRHDAAVAYGLFWYDPTTNTGLVEPMRTEDAHQGRGLARHVLTAGLHLLAAAGAERIKICYEPANPASSHLYLSVGFRPERQTLIYAGRTRS